MFMYEKQVDLRSAGVALYYKLKGGTYDLEFFKQNDIQKVILTGNFIKEIREFQRKLSKGKI